MKLRYKHKNAIDLKPLKIVSEEIARADFALSTTVVCIKLHWDFGNVAVANVTF